MSRLLLIPCSHVNREGETALRACYSLKNKYPRKIMIVTPPMIGVSPLALAAFGVASENYVAVNGCGRRCVDRLLSSICLVNPGFSFVLFEESSSDPRSALSISDDDVLRCAKELEASMSELLSKR